MKKYIIITTINPKTEGIARFERMSDWNIVIVGDKKSVPIKSSKNLTILSLQEQKKLGYKIVDLCPYNHYARKNIGYLYAIQNDADIIYDTDDDNLPYDDWQVLDFVCGKFYASGLKFVNIYQYFTDELIWPRGFPLDEIKKNAPISINENDPIDIGIWQGLSDLDPDVDAIYRLIINKRIKFKNKPPVALDKGHYCPFNSQNTLWQKNTFPFLYLPAMTSFRYTDILRGYIAQRLMWEQNLHLGFTKATVFQERNIHDLMNDFSDEIEGYMNTKSIVDLLDSLDLTSEPLLNIEAVYSALAEQGFIRIEELDVCRAWIADLKNIMGTIHSE